MCIYRLGRERAIVAPSPPLLDRTPHVRLVEGRVIACERLSFVVRERLLLSLEKGVTVLRRSGHCGSGVMRLRHYV
ncbi:hypothetical protein GOP47_0029215 [Adiantum capillus-veneris]|nr:hypothetical protein GOP47_0029215 [Adiantum capillus-veneris]